MRLLVISHTPHYIKDGQVVGWGPTIRELDYLSRLFDELVHLAPLYPGEAPHSALGYQSKRIRLHAVKPSGGDKLSDKLAIGLQYPAYARVILQELKQADMVHVRCPANLSLLAIVLLAVVRQPIYRWVKYAGNWQPDGREPLSYTLQRWWLQKGLHKGIVTINGSWPGQPNHIYTFPNPCLTQVELNAGLKASQHKQLELPIQLLFIGRMEAAKGAQRVIEIARGLASTGIDFHLTMIGDGPEKTAYQEKILASGFRDKIELTGWFPKNKLVEYYVPAHFLLLPSTASEGWPKVLSEGMAYGVVSLASAVSSIPQILTESGAGQALPPNEPQAYVRAIQAYLENPESWRQASLAGVGYAQKYSYDYYLALLKQTACQAWQLPLGEAFENPLTSEIDLA